MSGIGKSYWSKKLEEHGFTRFGCDDLITDHLAYQMGYNDPDQFDMHAWVGYPDQTTHAERAQKYLQTEELVLQDIIKFLENADENQNIVIDSTGSIIYMNPAIINQLQKLTDFVHLDITPADLDKMLAYYLNNPVAIIWNGYFQPTSNENRQETFERCYPQLIKSREKKYKEIAKIILPPEFHRNEGTQVGEFLAYLQK
jgi:shikimate kinase